MWIIIVGLIFYLFYITTPSSEYNKKKDSYIPPYKGHWENKGTLKDEAWQWVEPTYHTRYVNVIQRDGSYTINLSRINKEYAIDVIECKDQMDADTEIEIFKLDYPFATIHPDNPVCYVNVFNIRDEIQIHLCWEEKPNSFESIKCIDVKEGRELLKVMENYYWMYRETKIIDNLQDLKEH